ncbi:MAG: hypothetical protein UT33_C0013G0027 [Candidatus Peregrinibacteria bacterium GW2011_GWC2_39_14]|nr:MAG: hypothetical protein US92_C0007G0078 [Candidatus Peregrinibacteria bacterium GW2011_GWA2_38_36]KKR05175.1 MAG: hypothetical protein UT33_C0013G0027 [Candidatus Peregrinibacteria bacterium GW2011_GWC2_39_14]
MSLDAQKPENIEEPKDLKLNPEQLAKMSHDERAELQKEVLEKIYKRFEDDNEKLGKTANFFEEKASGGIYFSDNYTVHNWIGKIETQTYDFMDFVKLIKPPTLRISDIYDGIYLNLNRAKEYIEDCERAKFKMPISKEIIRDTEALLISTLSQIMQ